MSARKSNSMKSMREHVALIALTKRVGGVWKSHLMIEADFSTLVTPDSGRL